MIVCSFVFDQTRMKRFDDIIPNDFSNTEHKEKITDFRRKILSLFA